LGTIQPKYIRLAFPEGVFAVPNYDIYVLGESQLSISGGGILDGVTQGDGSHMMGRTITLNTNAWTPVAIKDNNADFSDNDSSQQLNGAQTIDGVSYGNNTRVEAEYGLTLTDGTNTWTVVGFNVTNSSPAYATIEGLAFIGGPGGFPPIGVPLTVTSAFEGPSFAQASYATPVCFTTGTLIDTPAGARPVETLRPGMSVQTRDHGVQKILWTGRRRMLAEAGFAPVRIKAGTMSNRTDLRVSQQHRILVTGWQAEMFFGADEVLVPALHLVGLPGVETITGGNVGYHHILLPCHAAVRSDGLWSESFHAGPSALDALLPYAREEVTAGFPELIGTPLAYPSLRKHEAALLQSIAA
jgi:hypothetical protein